jgi:hypothetical protein
MKTWVYLTDLAPNAIIRNLETGELRKILAGSVERYAPAGMRRYVLNEVDSGMYEETGEMLPITQVLAEDMSSVYYAPNSWNYDWPDFVHESEGDLALATRERIIAKLTDSMQQHPYDFQITGLQRRYLLYFSDGDMNSQRMFSNYFPIPSHASPLRADGTFRLPFSFTYTAAMRDAKQPIPRSLDLFGVTRPCLYAGPAWTVRFRLDDHDVLLDRCRVYVDDDGNFICSDWCQRHDHTTYGAGINLQMGIYSFDTWVTGPCVIRNVESGGFTPRNSTFKRTVIRNEMRKGAALPVDYDVAFASAMQTVKGSAPAIKYVDPDTIPPLTADVLKEAMTFALKSLHPADTEWVTATNVPAADTDSDPGPYTFQYKRVVCKDGFEVIAARHIANAGMPYDHGFTIDPESETGFMYVNSVDPAKSERLLEPLNDHWWMYSAAVHYRDKIALSKAEPEDLVTELDNGWFVSWFKNGDSDVLIPAAYHYASVLSEDESTREPCVAFVHLLSWAEGTRLDMFDVNQYLAGIRVEEPVNVFPVDNDGNVYAAYTLQDFATEFLVHDLRNDNSNTFCVSAAQHWYEQVKPVMRTATILEVA